MPSGCRTAKYRGCTRGRRAWRGNCRGVRQPARWRDGRIGRGRNRQAAPARSAPPCAAAGRPVAAPEGGLSQKAGGRKRCMDVGETGKRASITSTGEPPMIGRLAGLILDVQTFLSSIRARSRVAAAPMRRCNLRAQDGAYTSFHRICVHAGPMETPLCRMCFLFLHRQRGM